MLIILIAQLTTQKRGIKLNDEVNNKCATNVGKQRAQDIANKRGLSFSTIKRTFSYLSRAEEYYDPSDTKSLRNYILFAMGR